MCRRPEQAEEVSRSCDGRAIGRAVFVADGSHAEELPEARQHNPTVRTCSPQGVELQNLPRWWDGRMTDGRMDG